ncbi:MAG TPA: hypothetical protein VGM18_09465 [Candidatus Sulfotelmatobacter sp.]|jgi:hypothetical protein
MSKPNQWLKRAVRVLLTLAFAAFPIFCSAADDPAASLHGPAAGLYLKVQLASPLKMSRLKPGDVVEGGLSRDVYAADRKLFAAGSRVGLTVDHMEKRKRIPNDHWPWVVNAFTPRHENYPIFHTASVLDGGHESPLQVSLIAVSRLREVHAKTKKNSGAENGAVDLLPPTQKKSPAPTLVLEAFGVENSTASANFSASASETATAEESSRQEESKIATLPAGTRCKILLLGSISASKSLPGDVVQGRLLEPVLLNQKLVLPADSLFEGKVIKKTKPRMLSRAGSLYLIFTQLTLPGGNRIPIAASLAGAELDRRSHTRIDAEGGLHGERPGNPWMAINLGMSAGLAKEVDDGVQIAIEALVSTATDASTAGSARIVSTCVSGIYLATRHGRDVVLPRFTEMEISLDRPLSLNPTAPIETPTAVLGAK